MPPEPECNVGKWEVVVDNPKAPCIWIFICILLKTVYMFSLYVLCHVVQGKCIILQNTGEMFGTCEGGGPGKFCIPMETVWGQGSEVFLHSPCE